jgi:hypothetical protein
MINRKLFLFLAFLLTFTFLFTTGGRTQSFSSYRRGTPPKPGTQAPIITHAYAPDKGPYGLNWKIYIEAEDADADMDYVTVVLDYAGRGSYPHDRILIDPQHRNHLKGFLQWDTLRSTAAVLEDGTRITLRVSIIDKPGNKSNEVIFPFTFASGHTDRDDLPAPFNEENLPRIGYIDIDLINPNSG